ncbi:MAG: S8 family serine peptidase [Trueperaceae bacterium]|nr:S8 family serine peptidase [Trueperaceae bacterium]
MTFARYLFALVLLGAVWGSAQTDLSTLSAAQQQTLAAQVQQDLYGDDRAEKDGDLAKLDPTLVRLYRGTQLFGQAGGVALPFVRQRDGLVVIDAVAETDAATLLADLEALGLQNGAVFGRVVSGELPVTALAAAARVESLRGARASQALSFAGRVTSQGGRAMNVPAARSQFGVSGSGVTVGTLSDSFDRSDSNPRTTAQDDITSGDLPPRSRLNILDDNAPDDPNRPGELIDEGRAMMQLVHDVAPGSSQSFHTAFRGTANFATGILDLQAAGAEVIVDDILYFAEPMFQDGIIAQAVDQAVGRGAAYFSSAGNSGNQSYQSVFRSSGQSGPGNGDLHDFNPGSGVDIRQQITLPVDQTLVVILNWDEPYFSAGGANNNGSSNDLDLFLYTKTSARISFADADNRNVGVDPIEILSYRNDGTLDSDGDGQPDTTFNLAIELFEGAAPGLLKYVYLGGGVSAEYATGSATSFGHANARGAMSVGAAFYGDTPAFGTTPPVAEDFSSLGGVPILFGADGGRLAIPVVRAKPDITAPDGTNTTFFLNNDAENDGFPNFFGTSAAAPHAAAVAALLLEYAPDLAPAQLYALLRSTALDADNPYTPSFDTGFDRATGPGLLQADRAIASSRNSLVVDVGTSLGDPVVAGLGDTVGVLSTVFYPPTGSGAEPVTVREAKLELEPLNLQGLTAITQVSLFRDDNRNGQRDSGEALLASAPLNRGVASLVPSNPLTFSDETPLLFSVTFTSGTSSAALVGGALLALLPLSLLWRRPRYRVGGLSLLLVLALFVGCNGGGDDGNGDPPQSPLPYRATLTSVDAVSGGQASNVVGVPLDSPVIELRP